VAAALVHSFEAVDREIMTRCRVEGTKGGATGLVVLGIGVFGGWRGGPAKEVRVARKRRRLRLGFSVNASCGAVQRCMELQSCVGAQL